MHLGSGISRWKGLLLCLVIMSASLATAQTAPIITWPTPAAITSGTALSATQLDATAADATTGATVAGSYVYYPASGAVPTAGLHFLSVTFTPTDTTDYTTVTAEVQLAVTSATNSTGKVGSIPMFIGAASQGNSVITQVDNTIGIDLSAGATSAVVLGPMPTSLSLEYAVIDQPSLIVNGYVGGSTPHLGGNSIAVYDFRNIAEGESPNFAPPASIYLGKSRSGVAGTPGGIVQSGDYLGTLSFIGDNGTSFSTMGAFIGGVVDGTPSSTSLPGRLVFNTTTTGQASPSERMRITSAGYVGIGTTAPSSLLSVGSSSQFQVNSTGAVSTSGGLAVSAGAVSLPTASIANSALQGGGSLTVAAGNGLTGGGAVPLGGTTTVSLPSVGTAGTYGSTSQVPVITTDAFGRVTGVTSAAINTGSLAWSALANPTANLALSTGSQTTTFTSGSSTGANNLFNFADSASNTGTGDLVHIATAANSTLSPFAVYARGGTSASIQVLASGNVGIGTTAPAQKLEVNGYILTDAGIYFPGNSTPQTVPYTGTTCGGDYAESVDVAGDRKNYEPGDVLVIGAESGSDVLKSAEPYSTLVAGIYSTKPGIVGRRQTTDAKASITEVPMAMVGIVPTKVSAENGSIQRGDLLVSSSTPGYAMKGTDRSKMLGAVVGKALGNLVSGTGIIEVLVTLQ